MGGCAGMEKQKPATGSQPTDQQGKINNTSTNPETLNQPPIKNG
jgi:hypothetical protein